MEESTAKCLGQLVPRIDDSCGNLLLTNPFDIFLPVAMALWKQPDSVHVVQNPSLHLGNSLIGHHSRLSVLFVVAHETLPFFQPSALSRFASY
jgi:hypothetical protein